MSILLTIFIIVALIIAIVAAESDNFIFTTATMLATFAALQLLFGVPVWGAIVANPLNIILFTVLYVAAGAAYTAVWRWPEFLRERSHKIKDSYESWAAKHPTLIMADFKESYDYSSYKAGNNADKLANWVLAWPFSMVWELARKPAIMLWKVTYDVLGTMFTRIGHHVTDKILQDK
jgi:hypothetical protein